MDRERGPAHRSAVDPPRISRRLLLGALAAGGLSVVLGGCASPFAATRLRIATGRVGGNYYKLGESLSVVWQQEIGFTSPPEVQPTAGSGQNLDMLAAGGSDVVFSQVDTASARFEATPEGPRALRALARIYDDALHVVVPRDSPIRTVGELRGKRVSTGEANSGVAVIAGRVLEAAGLGEADLQGQELGIDGSITAMREDRIDAFFWSGGLPTDLIAALAVDVPIRLLDLDADDTLRRVRGTFPAYARGTVPATTYGIPDPVSTLLVKNFLLVAAEMPEPLAWALVEALFTEQEQLVRASPLFQRIDPRAAIGTQPVPLHPGAERYYRFDAR